MAMIKCPDCGNNMSDTADACPHCGRQAGLGWAAKVFGILVFAAVVFFGLLFLFG